VPDGGVNPYDALGGAEGVDRLVAAFYGAMERLPEARGIRAMHADDLAPMREALSAYLSGWLGGPPIYFERANPKCIRSVHAPYAIGAPERDAWVQCMDEALSACGAEPRVQGLLHDAFYRVADALRMDVRSGARPGGSGAT
jgi:hemoglobin